MVDDVHDFKFNTIGPASVGILFIQVYFTLPNCLLLSLTSAVVCGSYTSVPARFGIKFASRSY